MCAGVEELCAWSVRCDACDDGFEGFTWNEFVCLPRSALMDIDHTFATPRPEETEGGNGGGACPLYVATCHCLVRSLRACRFLAKILFCAKLVGNPPLHYDQRPSFIANLIESHTLDRAKNVMTHPKVGQTHLKKSLFCPLKRKILPQKPRYRGNFSWQIAWNRYFWHIWATQRSFKAKFGPNCDIWVIVVLAWSDQMCPLPSVICGPHWPQTFFVTLWHIL